MKKLSFLVALLPMLFCACASFTEENTAPIISDTPDLQAGFADETRTYVENNKYLRWHEDDRLSAFWGNTLNRQYKFNGKTGDNSGTFSLVPNGELCTGNIFDHIYAIYPYNESARITDEGVISFTLPAVQSYAEDSFGKDANTMIAVTENLEDTFLAFKNACGYLKLKLYNAKGAIIKRIEIKGNNNEKIAGAATATIAFGEAPVVTMLEDATTSITLDCGSGVMLGATAESATEFWVAVPQTTFSNGITVLVTDADGSIYGASTDKSVVVERNVIQPMAAIEVAVSQGEVSEAIPNNEIWYTSTDGAVVMPNATNIFGAKFLSNSYTTTVVRNQNGALKGVIRFDSDITVVGANAFSDCLTLYTIILPASITEIGDNAFNGCSALTALQCSSETPPTLGDNVFQQCGEGFAIYVPEQTTEDYQNSWKNYSSIINGGGMEDAEEEWTTPDDPTVIYYKTNDGYALDPYTTEGYGANFVSNDFNAATGEGALRFDGNVTKLPQSAFAVCSNLTHLRIPSATNTINDNAFYGCTSMKYLHMPVSVQHFRGNNIFSECTGVLFSDCKLERANLSSSKFTKVIYGDNAAICHSFEGCKTLESVDIGNNLKNIGGFKNCTALKEIIIPDQVEVISDSAFYGCSKLEKLVIGLGVNRIMRDIIVGCSKLKRIDIKDLVAWCNIDFISGDIISNPLEIAKNLYVNGTLVEDLLIPDTLTAIKYYTFCGAECIKSVVIPEGVTTISHNAFTYCSNLKSVSLPNSLTTISSSVFNYCTSLESITIPATVTSIGVGCFLNCESLKSVVIPNKITKIEKSTFYGCTSLSDVKLGSRIVEIAESAFTNCTSLKSITLPVTVKNIYRSAFSGAGLESLVIPNNVSSIGELAFERCKNLKNVTIGNGVTILSKSVFANCSAMENITLPEQLATIGNNAFYNCSSLQSVTIPDSATLIGESAFNGCSSLTNVTIGNSVTSIEYAAFSGCRSLTGVTIPNSVTLIGRYAFKSCTLLTSVIIPDSVTSIGNDAFYNCSSLTSITIPDSITAIGNSTFAGCSSLTSVTIPDSVTSIGDSAFYDCRSLTSITIPDSVTSIGGYAFSECTSLKEVCCKTTIPPTGGSNMFSYYKSGYKPIGCSIYVPKTSVEAYKAASGWSSYASYIVGYDF